MNEPRKPNPTFRIAIFIVVVVLLVLATLLYNAITEKREYERDNPEPASTTVPADSGAASAAGASQ
jgi:hypothetical protein